MDARREGLGPWRRRAALLALLALLVPFGPGAGRAHAAPDPTDPLFVFSPVPEPKPAAPIPPPTGFLDGPCGVAVDAAGNFYVSDYYHDTIDVYDGAADYNTAPVYGLRGYLGQLRGIDGLDGPCGLAIGAGGEIYVNSYHRSVREYGPWPGLSPGPLLAGAGVDDARPTSVASDPVSGRIYVDERTRIGAYEASGAPVEEGGAPLRLGLGTLGDGYGVAVSGYPGTAGDVYVADAASNTVKVYDPAGDKVAPVAEIDGSAALGGGFVSLRDAAIAVDRVTGEIYVTDDLQPGGAERPEGLVDVFAPTGAYEGHLKFEVVLGGPSGLAVDNSGSATQGRVYVTSGNTHLGAIYAYPPGAATTAAPLPPSDPPRPPGGRGLFPTGAIGAATVGGSLQIPCEGDACQVLPPQPKDPALGSTVAGPGNPRVRYRRFGRHRRRRAPAHRRHGRHHHRSRGRHRHHAGRRRATASVARSAGPAAGRGVAAPTAAGTTAIGDRASSLLEPPPALPVGFGAEVSGADGGPGVEAGAHPYALTLGVGLDQGSGESDLRTVRFELPADLLADPAAVPPCSAAAFAVPRSSTFEAGAVGESCPAYSQVGTLEAETAGGKVGSFGLFELEAPEGAAARLGAAPFGAPLVFDLHLLEGPGGSVHLALESSEVPAALALHGLRLALWGTPWDASHDGERGDCLNEAEPSFAWARCSVVGEPAQISEPLALLTLPTACGSPLAFGVQAEARQGPGLEAEALSPGTGGAPALVEGCGSLGFEPMAEGGLSTTQVSSPSGFVLHVRQEDQGFVDPRGRGEPRARTALVRLPEGVTLNPSLAAGLEGCSPGQLAAETATAEGCPEGSKIGTVSLTVPFYDGAIRGSIYLARPHDNPSGSLLAAYLVAKAADRGILLKADVELTPDPQDGTITATVEGLTQLPYRELTLEFRAGQRAVLASPASCGTSAARIELAPWSGTAAVGSTVGSPVHSGPGGAPCPTGTAPFHPSVTAGATNPAGNAYSPYFIHISRGDSEQEITSYSLVLPAGISGRLAGIPFCPDSSIEAARASSGTAEESRPSCPAASQVGRTVTGYGVGPALAYSEGKIYLAGPYHGAPLSLVSVDPATVGPFDLGTIVVRSAFELDPRTAQLRIDSSASDPIPHILDGVVLHVRDIRVYLDREEFTRNPSSCEPSELVSTITGSGASFSSRADDSTVTSTERFQLLDCRSLGFRPRLGLRLRGPAARGAFPALRATFVSRGARDANLRRIEVDMPHQLFLAQSHIRGVCTRPRFDAGRCPAASVYGRATAYTPLLDAPLRGDVYLRSSTGKLPDLVADLHSGSIRMILEGSIGPTKAGGIRVFFDGLPDAPIERFTMLLRGGRRGLLTNSVNVCEHPPRAAVKALGQNDVGAIFETTLRGQCRKGRHGSAHR